MRLTAAQIGAFANDWRVSRSRHSLACRLTDFSLDVRPLLPRKIHLPNRGLPVSAGRLEQAIVDLRLLVSALLERGDGINVWSAAGVGTDERRAPAMPNRFAEDPAARRAIELAAMEAVMAAERALGNSPVDVSAQKIGYDIASHDPDTGHLRFIEVKGRIDGADSVMITRQEIITSLHEPEKFILAVVSVNGGFAHAPRYVRGPLLDREPSFLETAVQFHLQRLLERAEAPR